MKKQLNTRNWWQTVKQQIAGVAYC